MVIEELEIHVAPGDLEGYLAADQANWTAFLSRQPGFIRKDVLLPVDRPGVVLLQIWWASREQWMGVDPAEMVAVDAAMGEHLYEATCRELVVVTPSDVR